MIVKIQRPLASSEKNPPALVYNRTRSFQSHMPLTPELTASLFPNGEAKVYIEAEEEGDTLLLGDRVEDQSW